MSELMNPKNNQTLLDQIQGFQPISSILRRWADLERWQMSIDPREFGKLEAQVEALQGEVHAMRNDIKTLLELANKSKGGFWVGMTIASLIGGAIAFIADRLVLQ